jgi:hypothetical protein
MGALEAAAADSPPVTLEEVLQGQPSNSRAVVTEDRGETGKIYGVVIGSVVSLEANGTAMVDFPGNPGEAPLAATALLGTSKARRGANVAIMFQRGDVMKPLIMGPIEDLSDESHPDLDLSSPEGGLIEVEMPEDELVITADKQITFSCGKSSITLTRSGKILIRGTESNRCQLLLRV